MRHQTNDATLTACRAGKKTDPRAFENAAVPMPQNYKLLIISLRRTNLHISFNQTGYLINYLIFN